MPRAFEALRKQHVGAVEAYLDRFFASSRQDGCALSADMSAYHFETGGKRLRALIPLYVFETLGHSAEKAIPLGAAVEMVHNATLVHDDLQDGDEMRRGRATVWKRYGSAQAINCGDSMFQYAFRLAGQLGVAAEQRCRLMDRMATSTLAVIEGQAQEFAMKDERFPVLDRYIGVIRGKTSGLFALPVVGALEALGESATLCRSVEAAAMDLGVLFQIQDDLLDVYGSKGRDRVATDVAEGKISVLVAHVYAVGGETDKSRLEAILRKPREQTSDGDIAEAIAIFGRYGAKEAAIAHIRKIQKHIATTPDLAESPALRGLLVELGETFLEPLGGIL